MTDTHTVPADYNLSSQIWRTIGLAQAFDALGGDKPKSTLPGFALALALVEKELAEQRAVMSGAVYKAAAKAGYDVTKVESIFTSIKDGAPVVEVKIADLVDRAEGV